MKHGNIRKELSVFCHSLVFSVANVKRKKQTRRAKKKGRKLSVEMTVKQITQTRFEVELDSNDLKILNIYSDEELRKPAEVIQEILDTTFQLARDKYISRLR